MQHYTRNTVEVSEWCRKCGKKTMHRVDGVKLGPCLDCLNRAPFVPGILGAIEKPAEPLTQGQLWGEEK